MNISIYISYTCCGGCWLLVVGCWLFVVGCCCLNIPFPSPKEESACALPYLFVINMGWDGLLNMRRMLHERSLGAKNSGHWVPFSSRHPFGWNTVGLGEKAPEKGRFEKNIMHLISIYFRLVRSLTGYTKLKLKQPMSWLEFRPLEERKGPKQTGRFQVYRSRLYYQNVWWFPSRQGTLCWGRTKSFVAGQKKNMIPGITPAIDVLPKKLVPSTEIPPNGLKHLGGWWLDFLVLVKDSYKSVANHQPPGKVLLMEKILHHLACTKPGINDGYFANDWIFTISTGAGFLPSTVCLYIFGIFQWFIKVDCHLEWWNLSSAHLSSQS